MSHMLHQQSQHWCYSIIWLCIFDSSYFFSHEESIVNDVMVCWYNSYELRIINNNYHYQIRKGEIMMKMYHGTQWYCHNILQCHNIFHIITITLSQYSVIATIVLPHIKGSIMHFSSRVIVMVMIMMLNRNSECPLLSIDKASGCFPATVCQVLDMKNNISIDGAKESSSIGCATTASRCTDVAVHRSKHNIIDR